MSTIGHPGGCARSGAWWKLLIVFVIVALGVSLTVRYTAPVDSTLRGTSVSDDSADSKTQHLLADGLQWIAPTATFLILVVPRHPTRVAPTLLPVKELYAEHWLENRPPPVC